MLSRLGAAETPLGLKYDGKALGSKATTPT